MRRGLLTALLYAGAAAVISVSAGLAWTSLLTRHIVDSRYSLQVRALMVLALVALGLMYRESRARSWSRLLRLKGVLLFGSATLVLYAFMALRAGVGMTEYLAVALYPFIWLSSSVLGLAASRRSGPPLAVANACAWTGALGGVIGYAAHWGWRDPLTTWYVNTSAALGGWQPAAGETFRAVGFELDPNYYGLLGLVVLSFVLGLQGDRVPRATAAAGAALVVAMSGSRTAGVALLLVLAVWGVTLLAEHEAALPRLREGSGVVGAVGAVAMLGVALSVAGTPQSTAARIGGSVAAAKGAAGTWGALSALVGGRVEIWRDAWSIYVQQPLGWFVPAALLLQGRSVHNEFLAVLIEGGPLYLAAYVAFLVWLALRVTPAVAPRGGLLLAACLGASALMLTPLKLGAAACMAFYFIGWLSGRTSGGKHEGA